MGPCAELGECGSLGFEGADLVSDDGMGRLPKAYPLAPTVRTSDNGVVYLTHTCTSPLGEHLLR